MKVFLIGYMYCGKTTVGHQLAQRLHCPFLDLDQAIEERYHSSIPLLFSRYGEQAFRIMERQALHSTADIEDAVVSTGGGTPCYFDNMEWINAHGCSVYLEAEAEVLLQRAALSRKPRPVLTGMGAEQRAAFVAEQLARRQPYYSQARLRFPAAQPDIERLSALVDEAIAACRPDSTQPR